MKRNDDFLLSTVAGRQILMPTGKALAAFNGMIILTETGAFIWEVLASECDIQGIVDALCNAFATDKQTALADTERFLTVLRNAGCIEEK